MREGKVKLNFRVSVWPLIAIYQQREQQAPGPINTSWCSGSSVGSRREKPRFLCLADNVDANKPNGARAQLMNYRGRGRTNASFCDTQSQVSMVTCSFLVDFFHLMFHSSNNIVVFIDVVLNIQLLLCVTSLLTSHIHSLRHFKEMLK